MGRPVKLLVGVYSDGSIVLVVTRHFALTFVAGKAAAVGHLTVMAILVNAWTMRNLSEAGFVFFGHIAALDEAVVILKNSQVPTLRIFINELISTMMPLGDLDCKVCWKLHMIFLKPVQVFS